MKLVDFRVWLDRLRVFPALLEHFLIDKGFRHAPLVLSEPLRRKGIRLLVPCADQELSLMLLVSRPVSSAPQGSALLVLVALFALHVPLEHLHPS